MGLIVFGKVRLATNIYIYIWQCLISFVHSRQTESPTTLVGPDATLQDVHTYFDVGLRNMKHRRRKKVSNKVRHNSSCEIILSHMFSGPWAWNVAHAHVGRGLRDLVVAVAVGRGQVRGLWPWPLAVAVGRGHGRGP